MCFSHVRLGGASTNGGANWFEAGFDAVAFWQAGGTMSPKRRKLLLVSLALTMLLTLLMFLPGRTPADPPLPNPNGYDDFVAAGKVITTNFSSYSSYTQDELRRLVSSNAEPLRLVRLGLTRRCAVPTNVTFASANFEALKRVASLLGWRRASSPNWTSHRRKPHAAMSRPLISATGLRAKGR